MLNTQLEETDGQIKQAERDMQAICERQRNLENWRDELESRRFARCAVIAPWRTLPIEIIGDIFVIAGKRDVSKPWKYQKSELRLPVAACVCSEWLEIALATPLLWTNIIIGTYSAYYSYSDKGSEAAMAQLWLSRSKSALVNLNCKLGPTTLSATWDTITANLHRIKELNIEVDEESQYAMVFARLALSAPNLRLFKLVYAPIVIPPQLPDDATSNLFAHNSPNIYSLIIPAGPQWPISLASRLTNIVLSTVEISKISQVIEFMRNAPCLRSLEMTQGPVDISPPPVHLPKPVITLPSLTEALIWGDNDHFVHLVLAHLDLPLLHRLTVKIGRHHTGLASRVDTSLPLFPLLESLSFFSSGTGLDVIESICRRCHLAQSLALLRYDDANAIIIDVIKDKELLPFITHLELIDIGATIYNQAGTSINDAYPGFLQHRLDIGQPIHKLSLRCTARTYMPPESEIMVFLPLVHQLDCVAIPIKYVLSYL